MITESTIYWLTRLDSIHETFVVIAAFSFLLLILIGSFILASTCLSSSENEDKKILKAQRKYFKISFYILILSFLFYILIPTTKEAIAILVIPKIANNENIQEIEKEFINLIENGYRRINNEHKI